MFKAGLTFVSALVLISVSARAETVWIPLVAGTTGFGGARWFTETRIVNEGSAPASVQITDVVGVGNPTRRNFVIPPRGVLDAPPFFTAETPPDQWPLFAAMAFTSDQPIKAYTAVHVTTLTPQDCIMPFPVGARPHWMGLCVPIGGPVLSGFRQFIPPASVADLHWLTAERGWYRTNLFVINPNTTPITMRATYRPFDGSIAVQKSYVVPARSLTPIFDVFGDPDLEPIREVHLAQEPRQGAATGSFRADGPFYVFAANVNNSPAGKDTTNRYTLSEPVISAAGP